jgi:putative aldouronate transport system permease protein
MRMTREEKIFQVFNYLFLSLFSFMTVYPFLYVLAASLSSPSAVEGGRVFIIPDKLEFESYRRIFANKLIWISYANTIFYTVVGTLFSMFVTVTGAYALSKNTLMGKKFFMFMISLTLWFGAGMIPTYVNLTDLGLQNSRAAIIIPFALNTFYLILMRTYFQSIPEAMGESAKIDGANDITVLWKIILPLSVPALATIGLYYAVSRWNGWFWASVLLKDVNKIPLQVYLRKLIIEMNVSEEMLRSSDVEKITSTTVIYATIVVSILPILAAYPFIQKYFVKGIMLGSLKG